MCLSYLPSFSIRGHLPQVYGKFIVIFIKCTSKKYVWLGLICCDTNAITIWNATGTFAYGQFIRCNTCLPVQYLNRSGTMFHTSNRSASFPCQWEKSTSGPNHYRRLHCQLPSNCDPHPADSPEGEFRSLYTQLYWTIEKYSSSWWLLTVWAYIIHSTLGLDDFG